MEKVNRRRYAIRKLKVARVKENDLVAVYCSLIRSIYGSVASAHLLNYVSNTSFERNSRESLVDHIP